MVVNYEFLDKEPMNNLITCLNFKIDKVVYLGFEEDIAKFRNSLESFLSKYCGVQEVAFCEVPRHDLQSKRAESIWCWQLSACSQHRLKRRCICSMSRGTN